MTYQNTFITVAPDCPAKQAIIPVGKRADMPVHVIQYQLLSKNPYVYTEEDLLYETYIRHQNIKEPGREAILAELAKKKQPCLRASVLAKKYGWGIQYDSEGKIALYGLGSLEYNTFAENKNGDLTLLEALRNKKL